MTLTRDVETQQLVEPSLMSKLVTQLKAPFSRHYWEEKFEPSEDETLVDSKLLSYAYLEAGLIETLGAYVYRPTCRFFADICFSTIAYFVVFYKRGFTPYDLRVAQQAGG